METGPATNLGIGLLLRGAAWVHWSFGSGSGRLRDLRSRGFCVASGGFVRFQVDGTGFIRAKGSRLGVQTGREDVSGQPRGSPYCQQA